MVAVDRLKSFFRNSSVIESENKYITVDSLKEDYENISIQLTGLTPSYYDDIIGQKHIVGWTINFNMFIYANIEGQTEAIYNNTFTQNLSLWIAQQNIDKALPKLIDGFETEIIEASSMGLYERHENGNCVYLIQCKAILNKG